MKSILELKDESSHAVHARAFKGSESLTDSTVLSLNTVIASQLSNNCASTTKLKENGVSAMLPSK